MPPTQSKRRFWLFGRRRPKPLHQRKPHFRMPSAEAPFSAGGADSRSRLRGCDARAIQPGGFVMKGRWTIRVCPGCGEIVAETFEYLHAGHEGHHEEPEVPVVACDDVHAWLTRMRDTTTDRHHPAWVAIDWLIGDWETRSGLEPEQDRG